MGTITKIRQVSPYVFVVFAVLFVGFMVLSDNISNLATTGGESIHTAAICKVNGEKIYYKDFEERVKVRVEQMRNDPQNAGMDIDEQQVRNQVWEELLREKLLIQAGERLGVTVSDEEILDILLENPPDYLRQSFTDAEGNFNRQLYLTIVTNPETIVNYLGQDPAQIDAETKAKYISDFRNQIIQITAYLKEAKMNEAMQGTLSVAYGISSPAYIEEKYINDNSSADINYLYVGINNIPDQVNITDSEIKEYYDKHKESFKVKNERKVKCLNFVIAPSEEDSSRNTKRIERLAEDLASVATIHQKDSIFSIKVNEFSGVENDWALIKDIAPQVVDLFVTATDGEIIGPLTLPDGVHFYRLDGRRSGEQEVVKASHILIGFGNNKDSAKAFADGLMKTININNFSEQAAQYSEDKGSGAQGGDLGYFGKGRMIPEFENAAFGAKVGSIVGPIESQFGYHIIYVADKKSDELKYSEIKFNLTISNATKNKIKRDAFAAMKQLQSGIPMEELAKKLGIECSESPYVTKDRPFYGSMYLTNKIFEGEMKDVLEPKEIYNGSSMVVLQISGIRKAGIGSLEDEKEFIASKLTKTKKLDVAKQKATELYNAVKANTTLMGLEGLPNDFKVQTATIRNNGIIMGAPTDFAATTNAFKLPEGKINEPVRCDNGYFIMEIRNRVVPPKDAAKNAQDIYRKQNSRNLFEQWFAKFREDSEIEDNRSKYYAEY